MVDRISYDDNVHYPWLHPEPQDCVATNTSPVSVLDCPSHSDADSLGGQQAAYGWSPEKAAYGTGGHTYADAAIKLPVQIISAVPSLADVHVSAAHRSETVDGSQHVRRPKIGQNDDQPSSLDDTSNTSSASSSRSISRRHKKSQSRENRLDKGRSQTGSKAGVKQSSSRSRSCIRRKRSTQNGGNPSWSVTRKLDGQLTLQSQHIALQYSWGPHSAVQGQISLIAWICATETIGRQWSESGATS